MLKTFERNVGNRGSKSNTSVFVKEQRVDGKRVNLYSNNNGLQLRCTLKNFERYSVIKVLPNLSFYPFGFLGTQGRQGRKNYTTTSLLNTTEFKLNPWFVTGFADAEGCFTVTFQKNLRVKNGYSITPRFKISLHSKDLQLLEQLKTFFGVGSIQSTGKNRDSFEYIVKSLKELNKVIIPHFDKYPLVTHKKADFELFKLVIANIVKKEHLSDEGLLRIVNLKASINKGLSAQLKTVFPQSKPHPRPTPRRGGLVIVPPPPYGGEELRPTIINPIVPHSQWIAGFTSGDGSFSVLIRQLTHSTPKVNPEEQFRIILRFVISQDKRDKELMTNIINYLSCGRLVEYDNMADIHVESSKDNLKFIIPFFIENNILGVKALDFSDWVKIANILKSKGFVLNKSEAQEIIRIKNGMNKGRV